MNNKPTFRQQYDKIVGAYLRNELNPTKCSACFVGNLMNGNDHWANGRDVLGKADLNPSRWGNTDDYLEAKLLTDECLNQYGFFYTQQEVVDIETVFLLALMDGLSRDYSTRICCGQSYSETYEDRLFKAMESALVALRKLHESKGEVIEDYTFIKRELSSL